MAALAFSTFCVHFLCLLYYINDVSSLEGKSTKRVQGNKYPFIVAIAHKPEYRPPFEDTHFCGGALISKRHVLTATHCFENEKFSELQVVAQSPDMTTDGSITFEVDSICTYESWLLHNNLPGENFMDTSILKLKVEDTKIIPAPYRMNDSLQKRTVSLIGFDISMKNSRIPRLMEASSKILKGPECLQKLRSYSSDYEELENFEGLICTKTKPWVLITDGDSGGPLLSENGIILGVNFATCPSSRLCPSKSKTVNVANRVIHFTEFIESMASL